MQLLSTGIFSYLLYGRLIILLLTDDGEMLDYVALCMDLLAIAALLVPGAMVTASTDHLLERLGLIVERTLSVQRDNATAVANSDKLVSRLTLLLTHVQTKEMGYRIFESFTLSFGFLKTLATYGLTLCIAVAKARS